MATSSNTPKQPAKRASDVPDGHRRVQIAYSADKPETIGHVVDVPEADARTMINQGRARAVAESTKLGRQDTKPALAEVPEASVESTTAASNDGPATAGQA